MDVDHLEEYADSLYTVESISLERSHPRQPVVLAPSHVTILLSFHSEVEVTKFRFHFKTQRRKSSPTKVVGVALTVVRRLLDTSA